MINYEIFDLLYSEFRHKSDDDNVVFTQQYVVGKLQIRIQFLKEENKIDVVECLVFLNKLQGKFVYVSDWLPFYFNCFKAGNNIFVYQFVSETEHQILMYEHFCLFLTKQMYFQKEHDLAQDYFSNIDENLGFTHNVSTSKFCYYVSFKKNNVDYNLASEFGANLNTE